MTSRQKLRLGEIEAQPPQGYDIEAGSTNLEGIRNLERNEGLKEDEVTEASQ